MGYKLNQKLGTYEAYFSKRHPVTRMPVSLRRKGIATHAEAKRIERELIALVNDKLKEKTVPRWTEAVKNYLEASRARGLLENTVFGYESTIRTHTYENWGERRIDEITTQEIRDLVKVGAGVKSENYQRNLLKIIRGVFTHAVEQNQLNRNPVPEMKFRPGDKLKGVLTKEQARIFLEKAKLHNWAWYPHVAMALYTGMRNGELFALTWDKVNLDGRQIKVDTSWNNKDGFKSTKSGDDRIVEIAPPLIPMLKELKLKAGDSPFVLPRMWKWEKGQQARELRMFLKGVGLPQIRFHDLRASFATMLLSQGVEPIKVMSLAGWKDLKTMQYYIRKAGVDIAGTTDGLILHNPSTEAATVLDFALRSES